MTRSELFRAQMGVAILYTADMGERLFNQARIQDVAQDRLAVPLIFFYCG